MQKLIACFLLVFCALNHKAQTLSISGNVQDTSAKNPLQNALSMVVRLNDSTLVKYNRTDKTGIFKIEALPLDTYIVVVSHPQFADQSFIVVGSEKQTFFDFGKIILPPKTNTLNEVIIYAYRDKVYYKGDTLMFTADSFKVKQNATVEDLLRKLPGVKVDSKGKITVQGKEVDQVLVDGDEFFGSDPTIATRNLNANTVDAVQVYDKKSDNTDSKDETVKVMNLKLKDEAKKGYFGKVSGAGGTGAGNYFYEGEVLANRFNKNRKVSVFGLGANSPKQQFNWNDIYQYGLDNEYNMSVGEDGERTFYSSNERENGIPQTLKAGFYYSDRLFKKTKLNMDYTFSQNRLKTGSNTNTQYFLSDTTYRNAQSDSSDKYNSTHNFNLKITQTIDSLTDLIITPKIKLIETSTNSRQLNDFISASEILTRQTQVNNTNNGTTLEASSNFKLNRRFKKKDRLLSLNYYFLSRADDYTSFLYSQNELFGSSAFTGITDQKKTNTGGRNEHQASVIYTEPLSAKIKLEFSYDYSFYKSLQDKRTKDFDGNAYDLENVFLTNNFINLRQTQRAGTKFIYEVKKYRLSFGTRIRQVVLTSDNLSNGTSLSQTVYNILPLANFRYRFSQSKVLTIDYSSSSRQPELTQLQPVFDNSNPNRITIGNPELRPTFSNNLNVNFYSFKPISNRNIYGGGYFNNTYNGITYNTTYDSLGVATSQPINVNGNFNTGTWFGMRFPVIKQLFFISPRLNTGYYNNVSYINNSKNNTSELSIKPNLEIEFRIEKLSFSIGGEYDYHKPYATLSNRSNQPYSTYKLTAEIEVKLPKKFIISTDADYTNNSQRTDGYNINFVIWNAALSKLFLKNENLIVSINAYDILNQNISTTRSIQDNRIVDYKGQIIRQYFLLRLTYKFNSNKAKKEDDDF